MRALRLAVVAMLWVLGGVAQAQVSPAYYVKVDARWYAVTSGTVAVDAGGNLLDIPGAILQSSCRRTSGALPELGAHSVLLGTQVFDVIYSDVAVRLHATSPPVVEVRTPTGDVSCGAGVVPPQTIVDAVANPPAPGAPLLFSNGFES